MRGAGSAFLGLAIFYWTAAKEHADKFMLGSTLTFALSSVVLPFYAQAFLPVREPDHYVPVGGMIVLITAHVYLYLKAK